MKNLDLCFLHKNLENLDPLTNDDVEGLKTFVQTVMYSGKMSEPNVECRIRLSALQDIQNSMNIPPDPDSLLQDLRKKQLQVNVWMQLDKITMTIFVPKSYGLKLRDEDGILVPLWYTGNQFPSSLQRNRRRGKKRSNTASEDFPSARIRPTGDISKAECANGELSDVTVEFQTMEHTIPAPVIVSESTNENEEDDEYDRQNEFQSESSNWKVSDYDSSTYSGSDHEWVP